MPNVNPDAITVTSQPRAFHQGTKPNDEPVPDSVSVIC